MIYIILKNISFQEFSLLDEALKRFYINSNTDYHTSMLKTLKLQELLEPSKYVCFAQRRSLSLYIYMWYVSRLWKLQINRPFVPKGLMHHMSSLIKWATRCSLLQNLCCFVTDTSHFEFFLYPWLCFKTWFPRKLLAVSHFEAMYLRVRTYYFSAFTSLKKLFLH
jgi:hypothetical protein